MYNIKKIKYHYYYDRQHRKYKIEKTEKESIKTYENKKSALKFIKNYKLEFKENIYSEEIYLLDLTEFNESTCLGNIKKYSKYMNTFGNVYCTPKELFKEI